MSIFTGGGPMSEPIRTIYRQLRCNLPADDDVMKKVEETASETCAQSTHPRPSGMHLASSGNKSSHLDRIRSQVDVLRRAFNRLYFIECNLLKFDDDELKEAKEEFEKSRNIIDSEDSSLVYIMTMVEEHLNTRRKRFRSDCQFLFSFATFMLLLAGALTMFVISILDSKCIMFIQKRADYYLTHNITDIMPFCLPVSHAEANMIIEGKEENVVSYLAYRTWRSSLLFNISIVIATLLIGKILTNFVERKPGFAGIRFNFTHLKIFGRRINFRVDHRDLDLKCDAKYHIERYLEKNGVYLEMFEYKYEDIEDLVRRCRGSRDIEYGIHERGPLTRAENMHNAGWGMARDSTSSSGRSSPHGNPEPSSQRASNLEPLITRQSLPADSEDFPRRRLGIQSIPILSPTSARYRPSMIEHEHELQSLCLQVPLPTLDNYGTTPETLYSETDIATPESGVCGRGTTTKDMDEGNETD